MRSTRCCDTALTTSPFNDLSRRTAPSLRINFVRVVVDSPGGCYIYSAGLFYSSGRPQSGACFHDFTHLATTSSPKGRLRLISPRVQKSSQSTSAPTSCCATTQKKPSTCARPAAARSIERHTQYKLARKYRQEETHTANHLPRFIFHTSLCCLVCFSWARCRLLSEAASEKFEEQNARGGHVLLLLSEKPIDLLYIYFVFVLGEKGTAALASCNTLRYFDFFNKDPFPGPLLLLPRAI